MRFLILVFSFFCILAAQAREYTIQSVPNPKSATTNGFVSNPDGIITNETEWAINTILDSLEHYNGTEVAVVVLESTGNVDIKDFAHQLFNYWGLGKKGVDNGLLILLVNDQRAITFETGYGIEGVLPDAICKRIQQKEMVPYFKEGKYDRGMLQGVMATVEVLKTGDYSEYEESFFQKHRWLAILLGCWASVFILGLLLISRGLRKSKKRNAYQRYFNIQSMSRKALGFSILSPPLVGAYLYLRGLKNKVRKSARKCPKCGSLVKARLTEKEEDAFLSPKKIKEEFLKSIDYDVWLCPSCNHAEILRYPLMSRYTQCPSCEAFAYHLISSRTLIPASTHSSGVGERIFKCEFCGKVKREEYIIPIIEQSSSSSSGGSGGGSWGGGSSGGGGATSRW